MEFDPNPTGDDHHGERIAALHHLYRNKIQAMVSLASLFGRRSPAGAGRMAFEDLRARYEAMTFVTFCEDERPGQVDLPELAARIFAIVDPDGLHRLDVTGRGATASAAYGSALAQILAEMLIELRRTGLSDTASGFARVDIDVAADGGFRIAAACEESAPATSGYDVELGRSLAHAAARNLGGTLSSATSGPFSCEAVIPAEKSRR